jgi:hypothetical protein
LHNVATEAQNLNQRGKGRVRNIVQTLNQYSGVLDIVAQWHPEYSALVWGSMKWLLLIAMNYISLAQRIADMLEEIGDNLPRFLLYQRLLPTSRMSQVISKLYAAVIEFLYCTIIYFHRSRIRRYFSALWVPFETRFKDTMDRIQRLQVCVENDARATAIAQQQIESTNFARQLSELALATKVTLQSVLDVKQRQTAMLLMDIRKDIFAGCDHHFVFQEEVLDVYKSIIAPEWQIWVLEESKHVASYCHEWTGLTYVQTETWQPAFIAGILSGILKAACPPTTFLFWSPGMTQTSALACVIFQLLRRHPDKLLYRMPPTFYADKFRRDSLSVESLWRVLLQVIVAVSGISCMLCIDTDNGEAVEFVRRFVEFGFTWTQTPFSLLIYNVADPQLSETPGLVELDVKFDIAMDLDSSEGLSKVVWMELGIHEGLSDGMRISLWSTMWRTLRYNTMALTNEIVTRLIESRLIALGKRTRLSKNRLKRKIISFLLFIPLDIPSDIRDFLRTSIHATANCEPQGPTAEACVGWRAELLDAQKRSACWAGVSDVLKRTILRLFEKKVLMKLREVIDVEKRKSTDSFRTGSINLTDTIEEIFTVDNWDASSIDDARRSLLGAITKAAEVGLLYVLKTTRRVTDIVKDEDQAELTADGRMA